MRYPYLDAARGVALVLMVVNHTARYWTSDDLDASSLIYVTTSGAGPLFLFLVGFVLPMSYRASAHPVRRAVQRAAVLFAAGYVVNIVLAPQQPFLGSNVLHTIGAALLVGLLARPFLRQPSGRYAIAAAGVAVYASFVLWFGAIETWVGAHPLAARLLFHDFPLWPWVGLILLGLSLGAAAADIGDDLARARFYRGLGLAGVVTAAGALVAEWWWPVAPRLAFAADLLITNHWIPRGPTVGWVLAWVFVAIAACYRLAAQGTSLRRLVIFGRTALFLYVAHHVIVVTVVQRGLDVSLRWWLLYWLATALLLALLVPLGAGWMALTRRPRRQAPAAPARLPTAA